MIRKFTKFCRWLWFAVRYAGILRDLPLSTGIGKGVEFIGGGKKAICIGCRVTLCSRVTFEVVTGGTISVGDNAWISKDVMISARQEVYIGSNAMIGEFSSIRDADHGSELTEIPMRNQGMIASPVWIGDDVWIGRGVAILKGVTIGQGSIIGANAVVTKDIPEYSIAVGIPARVVRKRIL